jgi:hypothetical protein
MSKKKGQKKKMLYVLAVLHCRKQCMKQGEKDLRADGRCMPEYGEL